MTLYDEYAVLDAQIKHLENQKEGLRNEIIVEMIAKGEEPVETSVGKFSITKLKTWTYPKRVIELGDKFKAEKAKAESTGDATFVEKESLRFTAIKL